jgi:hypothetical protein
VVEAHHLATGCLLDERLQRWPRRFNQLGPHVLHQIPATLGNLLLCRCQRTLDADNQKAEVVFAVWAGRAGGDAVRV